MSVQSERAIEMRRGFLRRLKTMIPRLLLASVPLLLACVALFGASDLLGAVGAYVAVMAGLGVFLAMVVYAWWHYRVEPLLRRDAELRARLAIQKADAARGAAAQLDLAPWPTGNPDSGPGQSQPSGSAGSGGGCDYDDPGGPRL